jgi:hypothetical protein
MEPARKSSCGMSLVSFPLTSRGEEAACIHISTPKVSCLVCGAIRITHTRQAGGPVWNSQPHLHNCRPATGRVMVGREKQASVTTRCIPKQCICDCILLCQLKHDQQHILTFDCDLPPPLKTLPSFILPGHNDGPLMARPQNRKRPRANELSQSNPPSKKAKLARESNFSPEFWDNLSKVWLTPRALRELDRRNKAQPSPRFAVPELYATKLARFARHGGPDLRHLRGVWFLAACDSQQLTVQSSLPNGRVLRTI